MEDESPGRRLLRHPEAGSNPDILAVLANRKISFDSWVTYGASRRLPEGSLRRWEPYHTPVY